MQITSRGKVRRRRRARRVRVFGRRGRRRASVGPASGARAPMRL
jgi:hypothetical protein